MEIAELRPGIIVEGPKWPEPVEIKKIENSGEYVNIIGATTISNQHIDQLLRLEELSQISVALVKTDFSSEPWKIFLALNHYHS